VLEARRAVGAAVCWAVSVAVSSVDDEARRDKKILLSVICKGRPMIGIKMKSSGDDSGVGTSLHDLPRAWKEEVKLAIEGRRMGGQQGA
jgi:hypothetical protein